MSEKLICNLTFAEIKELADIVSEKKLGKIDIKVDDSRIIIEDKKTRPMIAPQSQMMFAQPQVFENAPVSATSEVQPEAPKAVTQSGNTVKSPIVGTFYAAASPEKPPFVTVGQQVKKGDVLMIIESMKLMNEVTSEFDGTVKEILVENGNPVEFDQPVMIIE